MKNYKKFVCSSCNCLKNSEIFTQEIFSLPLYPSLTFKDQKKIVRTINSITSKFN